MVQIRGLSPGTIVINAYEDLDRTIRFSEVDENGDFVNWLDINALTNSGAGTMWGSVKANFGGTELIALTVAVATNPAPAGNAGYVKMSATAAQTGLLQDPAGGGAAIESGVLDLWFEIEQSGHEDEGDDKRLGLFRWVLSKSVSNTNPTPGPG